VFIYCYLIILTVYQVLHPRHKLEYFKRAGWDDEWIATTREIVQTEYDRSYAFMEVDEPDDLQPEPVCASQAVAFVLVTDRGISSQKTCPTISSTTFLSSHVPKHPLPWVTNSIAICPLLWSLSMMPCFGGMKSASSFQGFHAWHSITFPFLVRQLSFFLC